MRLGDLLTAAGMLKLEQLREAIEIARQQSLPVGRVLIMYGYLSGLQLQAAIHLQSMLKDNLIDYDKALKVLGLIAKSNIPVEEALQQIGWEQSEPRGKTNKLGEILLAAGIIDNQQLELGLQHSGVTGLPLGRVLVNLGVISEQLLSSALSAQVLIREQRIDRDKAVHGLIAAKERQISIEQSLQEIGQLQLPLRPGVRLGQLLVMAGLLEEKDLMHALELGLVQEQPIGKTLLGLNLVSEDNLSKALEAQALVADGMDIDQAANILTTAIAKSTTIAHASSLLLGSHKATELETDTPTLPLYQLLQFAGLLGPQELEAAVRVGTQDTEIMSRMLQKAGILDSHVISAAVACTDLVTKRVLKTEQAIMAVNNCKHMKGSIYEFFDEFGWAHPSGLTPPAQTSTSDQVAPPEPAIDRPPTNESVTAESSGTEYAAAPPPAPTPQPLQSESGQYNALSGQYNAVSDQQPSVSGKQNTIADQPGAVSGQFNEGWGQQGPVSGQHTSLSGQQSTVADQPGALSGQFNEGWGQQGPVSGQHSSISGQFSEVSGQQQSPGSGQYNALPEPAPPTPAKPTLTEQLFSTPQAKPEAEPWAAAPSARPEAPNQVTSGGPYAPAQFSSGGPYAPVTATGSHPPVSATGTHPPISPGPQPAPVTATGTHPPIGAEPQPAPVTATGSHPPIRVEPQPVPEQPEAPPPEPEPKKETKPRKKLRDLIP